jgi:hypothetical protein
MKELQSPQRCGDAAALTQRGLRGMLRLWVGFSRFMQRPVVRMATPTRSPSRPGASLCSLANLAWFVTTRYAHHCLWAVLHYYLAAQAAMWLVCGVLSVARFAFGARLYSITPYSCDSLTRSAHDRVLL